MDQRTEKNTQSLKSLQELLKDIIKNPQNFSHLNEVSVALKSQASLAKFHDKGKGISRSSINTHKRIAQSAIEGGYDALNRLRLNAKLGLERKQYDSKPPDKKTKSGLSLVIKTLEREKQELMYDLLLLTLAFERSLTQGRHYASKGNATLQALCKKEQRELLDILSLRRNALDTNVLKIHGE